MPMHHLEILAIFLGKNPCMVPIVRRRQEVVTQMISLNLVVADSQGAKQPHQEECGQVGLNVRASNKTSKESHG
jgi:hypothetical protein